MTFTRRAATLLAPLLLLACGEQRTGRVSLRLTDAPGDLAAAVVTIARIELVGSGGTVVLRDTPVTTDLLSLANDTAELVADAVVPTGNYSQLRFVITGGYVGVAQDGGGALIHASSPTYEGLPHEAIVSGTLQMPSFAQSGLKVTLPGGGLDVGTDAYVLLVDFDVAQSFGHDTGSDAWVMHPVMHAIELQLSGTLDVSLTLGGVTLPSSAQFSAVLTNSEGSAEVLPLVDLGGGAFGATFRYLVPGTYSVGFTSVGFTAAGVPAFTTSPAVPATVTVASGQPTSASFVLTSAQ